jgi:seryl-tRNA synthetase
MHDPRALLDPTTEAARKLARRGYELDEARLRDLLDRRNAAIQEGDEARSESKRLAAEVQAAGRQGQDTSELVARARELKSAIHDVEQRERDLQAELQEMLLWVPNLPDDTTPDGMTEDEAVEIRRWGTPQEFDFEVRDHVEVGETLGILDLARAAKLSGARFALLKGPGAALERGLASFFLTLHTSRHDYVEYSPPSLVTRETMTGSGQLPKFEEDLFATSTGDRDLFLIPTAEVPLANLFAGEALPIDDLPLGLTAHTPCFRSEAGSHGRDTRGMIRLHQFSKVELVRVCRPEDARDQLELMLGHAETCLQELGLPYRVVALAAGDISFAAQFTYDIEVWLPAQGTYREISSVSNCGQFQARRSGLRYKGPDKKRDFVATLNGSGLPIGRTLVAILEQCQQADGSVTLPDALVPHVGFKSIHPDGTTS